MWRRSVGFVVSALIAGLVAIALFSAPFVRHVWSRHTYARRLGIARLISASNALPYRHVLPRVTPLFDYRPYRPVERGSIDTSEAELLESVAPFARTNTHDDNASTLQGAGVAMLTAGEPAQACALLERALYTASGERSVVPAIARSNDARLLTDLAAAYYQRGVANNDPESTLSAIDAATRATQLDPKFEVAAFNRALAIERVHAPDRAIAAWKDYLRLDDAEGWRAEARAHVGALDQLRKVSPKTDLASHIENELLPSWGAAFLRGDAAMADSKLSEASAAAHELATCCGDDFYDKAVESAQDSARHDRRHALTLAAAYQKYQEGYALSRTDETTKSLPALEASRDALVSLGDIFAVKPWRLAAVSYALIGEHEKALRETDAALEYCRARPGCSSTVRGHLLWGRGLVFGRLGDPQRANAEFAEALHGFESAHDTQNAASIHALIASNLIFLGATDDAWPHLMTAMRAADASGRMRRIYIAYTGATDAASTRHHWASARMFEDVIIDSERREHNVVLLADSLLTRGQILAAVSPAEARHDFAEARQIATTIPDARRRAKVLASAATSEAGVLTPQEAARSLTEALQYYDDVKDHYHVAEIYAKRAEEEEKSGMKGAAEADFRHCIDELELERESIAPSDLRMTSFTRSSSVFDEVIEHLWSSARRADAFEMAEESRGREFARAASRTQQFRLADAAHALREGEVLVDYAVLPDHMLAWVVDARGVVTWIDSPVTAEQLQDAADGLRDGFDAAIARLSTLVWRPVSAPVRGARRVIIVPNKALRAVPFAALRDVSTSRFLVEDHEIVVAPSAAAYSESVRRDGQLRRRDGSVVIAMSTGGDESRHLPRLEAGADEAAAVRDIYRGRSVVAGAMTPERFLAMTRDAKIVHVIAHALSNDVHPQYASIVFEKGRQGGDLYADTIAKTTWPSTRVVFLSTCGIASPGAYNDVPLTLPESFVAAGVPIVVASMAPVDDARASEFARIFHRQFAQSGDAVVALRTAQLHFLNADRNNVKAWSFWTAIGGSS